MGIVERRIQHEYETQKIPEVVPTYNQGGALDDVKFEINWASFNDDRKAYEELWGVWTQPLSAVEAVCCDKIGQDAIRGGLKKIVIQNVGSNDDVKAEFKDGVLTAYMNLALGG